MLHHRNSLLLLNPLSLISCNASIRKGRPVSVVRAVERGESSSEFEVNSEKAREALDKLDKQLLSLSTNNKQQNPSPPPATKLTRAQYLERQQPQVREEAPDFSGSFLPYSAFVLLLFSIFYNVLFATVIKPSIDFPEQVEATSVGKLPTPKPMPLTPPTTDSLKL